MIIIAVVALILLGGGGFAAFKMFAAKTPPKAPEAAAAAAAPGEGAKPAAAAADDDEEEPAAGGGEGAAGPPVLVLSRLIVNLDGGNRKNAFLKCDLSILFRDEELGKLAASDKPTAENSIAKAIVLAALSGKTVEEASDLETRESVRQEIKDKLNEKWANRNSKERVEKAKKAGKAVKPPVKDVLVTDWAIQL